MQRSVWFALLQRDLKARFEGRWLGALWTLFEPMAILGMTLAVFGFLRNRVVPGMPFSLFLITGIIPFLVFRNVVTRVMGAIDSSRGLFGYRQVKPIDVFVTRAAMEVVLYTAIFVVFVAVMGWSGQPWFPDHPLHLMMAGAVMVCLAFSFGLILAVLTDDWPQLRVFVRLMFMPLYFVSGVVFPMTGLPYEARAWVLWNPILHLVEIHRSYFVQAYPVIEEVNLQYPAFMAVVLLATGLALYRVRRFRLLAT